MLLSSSLKKLTEHLTVSNFKSRLLALLAMTTLAGNKHTSLFLLAVSDEEKSVFYDIDTWAKCYKTFSVRNL
jgi:hypothetical protein